ncbi:MAG: multidrug effflux MFS transporter [Saprospiraceae bacterium]|nr:multidrug effflux MFS transporter [Saprospiraceae bacterium]
MTEKYFTQNKTLIIIILGLLSAIGPFSIDSYLPGFPSIARDLDITVEKVSYSLSAFFIGISIGQLLYGPLLDRFGRKKPLMIGLVVYILGSLGCMMASTIEALIAFRFIQALGGCVGMVAPRAMVRDAYPVKESARIFSALILVIGISPLIAPTIGSVLVEHFGWHSVFLFQTIFVGVLLVAVVFFLAETKADDPNHSLLPKAVTTVFLKVLFQRSFLTYAFTAAFMAGGLYAYISGSPYVFMELFGMSEWAYGLMFAALAAGLIGSSQLNRLLLKTYSPEKIFNISVIAQTCFGLSLFVLSWAGMLELRSACLLIFLYLSCQGFTFPNASALALAPFAKEAGSASALLGAIQMGIGAFAAALVGFLGNGSSMPMTGVMALFASIGLLIYFIGRREITSVISS